jgi:hypothetical protein
VIHFTSSQHAKLTSSPNRQTASMTRQSTMRLAYRSDFSFSNERYTGSHPKTILPLKSGNYADLQSSIAVHMRPPMTNHVKHKTTTTSNYPLQLHKQGLHPRLPHTLHLTSIFIYTDKITKDVYTRLYNEKTPLNVFLPLVTNNNNNNNNKKPFTTQNNPQPERQSLNGQNPRPNIPTVDRDKNTTKTIQNPF